MSVKKVGSLEKYINTLANMLAYIAMGALFVMMALGTGDVLGRYFFNHPIKGTFELFEVLLVAVVLLSLARTQHQGEHITMDFLWIRLSPRIQRRLGFATTVILACLFGIMTWRGIDVVIMFFNDGRLIVNLMVPRYTTQLIAPLGTLALFLVLSAQAVRLFSEIRERD